MNEDPQSKCLARLMQTGIWTLDSSTTVNVYRLLDVDGSGPLKFQFSANSAGGGHSLNFFDCVRQDFASCRPESIRVVILVPLISAFFNSVAAGEKEELINDVTETEAVRMDVLLHTFTKRPALPQLLHVHSSFIAVDVVVISIPRSVALTELIVGSDLVYSVAFSLATFNAIALLTASCTLIPLMFQKWRANFVKAHIVHKTVSNDLYSKEMQDFQEDNLKVNGRLNKILELKWPELPFFFCVRGSDIDSKFVQIESLIYDNELSNKL
ncbi:hypothetical protein T4C_12465 [Trichinella pseudospiralis]|uniref:Uncharacterized protein n=1 Tax=Trichinella pseudospiralis TaxID=6337 RepID=A0A0V1JIT7_TRIPS|nr:hypothetical protein T4C_12465 [Trichinella pseudospiralis]